MREVMWTLVLLKLSYLVCFNNAINYTGPIVEVPQVGNIQGISGLKSKIQKREYFSFLGIEYGEPPVGKMRFQPTLLRKPYTEKVFHANSYGPACLQMMSLPIPKADALLQQYTFMPYTKHFSVFGRNQDSNRSMNEIIGAENCLVLNIYTPKLPSTQMLAAFPVLVFIHGGSFSGGFSSMYSPKRFMDQDIVLVVIQYRLGPLGFLYLGTPEAPGNAGLYDQNLALQWIQKHISYFGGDPNRVTINGQSAGSASVSFHIISPLSKGLFHGIIGESGAAISPWALAKNPVRDAMNFAQFAGCKTGSPSQAALCLQNMPGNDLIQKYVKFKSYCLSKFITNLVDSAPCIQANASVLGVEPFLSQPPIEILKSGNFNHVPAIYGNVRDEGSFITKMLLTSYLLPKGLDHNKHFLKYDFIKDVLDQLNMDDPSGFTVEAITRIYFDGLTLGDFQSMVPGLTDMFGAVYLKSSTYQTIKYNSLYNTSYFYSFDFFRHRELKIFNYMLKYIIPKGIPHSEELLYLYIPDFISQLNKTETLLSEKMIKMWTNFVYYGRPTLNVSEDLHLPNWEPFKIEDPKFLNILSPTNLTMDIDFPKLWTYDKDHALKLSEGGSEDNEINGYTKEHKRRLKYSLLT